MFGFKKKEKKEKKPLFMQAKDVFPIIKSDYDQGIAFMLIDFTLNGHTHTMGSSLIPNAEEKKENIYFVFDDNRYDTYEAFVDGAEADGIQLSQADTVIEIVRAGIVDGDALIKTPWGDTRLARMALTD